MKRFLGELALARLPALRAAQVPAPLTRVALVPAPLTTTSATRSARVWSCQCPAVMVRKQTRSDMLAFGADVGRRNSEATNDVWVYPRLRRCCSWIGCLLTLA